MTDLAAKPRGWWRLRPRKKDRAGGLGERVYVVQHEADGGVLVSGRRGLKTSRITAEQFAGAEPAEHRSILYIGAKVFPP